MKHYIYLCIYICISSAFISLYAQSNLQDWKESYCADIDKITSYNMWSCDTRVNQYISFGNKDLVNVFKFTSNRDRATLKPYYRLKDFPSSIFDYDKLKLYVENEKMVYIPYESRLYKIDVDKEEWYQYVSQRRINFNDGQCFLMNDKHYFIDYNYNNLYQLKLEKEGILTPRLLGYLDYKTIKILSIVVLEDKFYYLSQDGFCEVSINNNKVNCELIPSVTSMDETSILVTDKQSKIWIINSANGVIEYDTTNKNVREIAEFPGNESKINVCFYSNGYLYYISQDKKFYSLNVSHSEKKRKNTRFGKKQLENVRKGLYRAIGHENNMTLEDLELPKDIDLGYGEHPYLVNGNLIYNANARTNKIDCFNIEDKPKITYALEDTPEKIDFFYGKCFYKDNNHYFLDCRNKKLYQLQLNEPTDEREDGTITVIPCYDLEYAPKADTSIVVLADTLYYFSNSGFCAVKVNDTEVTSEIIDSVTVTDKVSVLVTDGEYRIWIINETDGVIEYNTQTEKAKTIDIFPFFSNYDVENNVSFQGIFINDTKQELSTTAFYSNRYLHYMINGAVYFLPVPPDDKNQIQKIQDIPEYIPILSKPPKKIERTKTGRRIQPKPRRSRLDSHFVKTPSSFLDLKPAN